MKLLCNKLVLIEGINIVQKAVSNKSTLPILEGILLETSETLKLSGNNLELGIECTVEATIQEKGSVVLNSKIFGDIIKKLPNDIIYIEVEENYNTIIKSGNSEFNIIGFSSEEFPELPPVEKEDGMLIPAEQLKSMIRQTLFAVGTNESKLILTGSCIELEDGTFNIVSVDGYRLALRKEKLVEANEHMSFVIPGTTLNELLKIIKDDNKNIQLFTTEKHILFEFDQCRIVSRLLEGEFLNYRQIVPKEYSLRVKTGVKPLIESIERAALIITSDYQKYPVILHIKNDKIVVSCTTQTGKVQDAVDAETFGDDLEIGFNYRYMLDALKACECEEVYLEFNTSISPCIIKPIEEETFIYLVLPVRLRNE